MKFPPNNKADGKNNEVSEHLIKPESPFDPLKLENLAHKRFEIHLHDSIQKLQRMILKMLLDKIPVAEFRQCFIADIVSPLRKLDIRELIMPGACTNAKSALGLWLETIMQSQIK